MKTSRNVSEFMIAYCGEVCTTCSAYVATRSGDPVALQRVADEWNARDGTSLVAEDCICDGCRGDGRRIGYCRTCAVRACAIARSLENCAHCDDYGCEKLVVCFEHSAETKVVLDRIRQSLPKS
ncbi:MAG: DUF3795 domain-containing protein [Anaerolineae bacterium]